MTPRAAHSRKKAISTFGPRVASACSQRRPRAFTAMELMMGLVITGLVMTALGGVMTAVAQGWRASEITQAGSVSEMAAVARINRTLREARAVGSPTADGGALMFWEDDAADGLPSFAGKAQFSEMASIEFDATSGEVRVVRMDAITWDLLLQSYDLDDLIASDVVAVLRSLLGGSTSRASKSVLAENVKSAEFELVLGDLSAGTASRVNYTLVFERPVPGRAGQLSTSVVIGSATLRAQQEED